MSRTEPPSGAPPPAEARHSDGTPIDLETLASQICERYRQAFPDEEERYGEAGIRWCRHDNQYILAWAIQDARDGTVRLSEQTRWLAGILDSRGFPVERLVHSLEIAAETVLDSDQVGPLAEKVSRLLSNAAGGLGEETQA